MNNAFFRSRCETNTPGQRLTLTTLVILVVSALVSFSCGDFGEEFLPISVGGNFNLYVSNQSMVDPVDVKVTIDGRRAVSQDFYHRGGHNWIRFEFQLEPGNHTVKAQSEKGEASAEHAFSVESSLWCVIDYWGIDPGGFSIGFGTGGGPGFM